MYRCFLCVIGADFLEVYSCGIASIDFCKLTMREIMMTENDAWRILKARGWFEDGGEKDEDISADCKKAFERVWGLFRFEQESTQGCMPVFERVIILFYF